MINSSISYYCDDDADNCVVATLYADISTTTTSLAKVAYSSY